jgi:hypothetical protein
MNTKEINQLIKFREKHGHYPHVYHRALMRHSLSGGDAFTDFFTQTLPGGFKDATDALAHGFDELGNDLKTGFGVVGNYIVNHRDVFITAIVIGALMVVFPEFAPEIAYTGVGELLPKILGSAPPQATGAPTQEDIDKAVAAYKADPRYQYMIDRASHFIRDFSSYVKNDMPTATTGSGRMIGGRGGYAESSGPSTYSWTRPNNVTMSSENGGDILLHYDKGGQEMVAPIRIKIKTGGDSLMNYTIPISNTDYYGHVDTTELNADGSNYRDLAKRVNITTIPWAATHPR